MSTAPGRPPRKAHGVETSQLGPDWVVGADGVPYRRGARVILLDESDRVLMVRGHDVDEPARSWWFTPGGGIDPAETAPEAAARELAEETGVLVAATELTGPVATRTALFDFARQTVRQDEEFFHARVRAPAFLVTDGWTPVERLFMDEVRWWHLDELAEVREEIFPGGFLALVRHLRDGWDGVVRRLPDQTPEP